MIRLGLVLAALWVAVPAWGNTYRFGLFVGNDEGAPGDPELVFAELDAEKMHDLFVDFGGVKPGDAVLLQGGTVNAVRHQLDQIGARIRAIEADGHDAMFFFYYSGHGDDEGLHVGAGRLGNEELRTRLESTAATVTVAMVDACQSGGLVRQKGGARGPSLAFAIPTVESTHGTAIITSSAASELSQESDEIGGGFFTHYLHTALAGAADWNRDGEVSLSEAYAYVHSETAFHTRDAAQIQTPSVDLDLVGAGEIVLTTLEEASARLAFQGDLEGTFGVWDESRKRYVAQLEGNAALAIALRPGTFYVHKRMPGWVEEARYTVRRGETHAVLAEDFVTVSYESSAARGDLEKVVRRSNLPDLSLRFVVGYRSLSIANQAPDAYFAPHAIGGVQATFLGKRSTYAGFDVRTGGGLALLQIPGLAPVESRQTSTSLGGTIGFVTGPRLVRAGLGARTSATVMTRQFPDQGLPNQAATALGVGLDTWVGIHHGRFTGDLAIDWQLLVTKWDDSEGWPACTDVVLSLGYRF